MGSQVRARYPRIHTFSSLKSRDYRLLWTANIFNNMALWLQLLTLGWLVWRLTLDPETGQGSVLLSGTVAGLRALPTLVIGPWAGVLVDRMDRRKLVISLQVFTAIAAISFGFLVASGIVEVWHVFAYSATAAICSTFFQPARQALIVNTVPSRDLGNALALNAMTVTANRLTGAMIGGLLITTVGIKWNFFVEGAAYAVMAALLIPMRTPYQEESTARRSSVMTNLKEGIGYIWNENRLILHLIVLSLILNLVFMPIPALLVAYSGEVLHEEADVVGYLMAAQGVGGLTATFIIASLGFVIKKGKVALIALCTGSVAILTLAQSNWLFLSLAMMVFLGFSQTNFIVGNQTLVQSMAPDPLRGRVTSIYSMAQGLSPVAIFLLSLVMALTTVSGALTVLASISLVVALYFLFSFRQVRQLE